MPDERGPATPVHHGACIPRGLHAGAATSAGGRFGRMFGFLPARDMDADAIAALLRVMRRRGFEHEGENPHIPAGYTYLGQFIDHDITFDPTSQLDRDNDPYGLTNFRTPRLDLDSLYGSGPAVTPFLYEWTNVDDRGVKLLVGESAAGPHGTVKDLPRNQQDLALIGDPRNDENLVVSQLHLAFVLFHNNVVEYVRVKEHLTGAELLRESQRLVRWHYQWIVAHDYLRRIAGTTMAERVLKPGRVPQVQLRHYRCDGAPAIPVEFSGAAFRFGHSMVRESYSVHRGAPAQAILSPKTSPTELEHLGGFRRLPAELEIDWEFFFADPSPQLSNRIDTAIADPLRKLPVGINRDRAPLAQLNLRRAVALGLPAGTDVARAMGEQPLSDEQLIPSTLPPSTVTPDLRPLLLRAIPLWYYVLCEAALLHEGRHLGPVGGRIVAEVLVGLLDADPNSYLSQAPAWRPELPGAGGDFTAADLVRFARLSPTQVAAAAQPG